MTPVPEITQDTSDLTWHLHKVADTVRWRVTLKYRENRTHALWLRSRWRSVLGGGLVFFHDKQKPVGSTKWPRLLCSGSSVAPEPAGATSPAAPPARSCEERDVCEPPRSSSWAQRPPRGHPPLAQGSPAPGHSPAAAPVPGPGRAGPGQAHTRGPKAHASQAGLDRFLRYSKHLNFSFR